MENSEDLLKEFEYYTKLINDFKKKQQSSGDTSRETKCEMPSSLSPPVALARKDTSFTESTKFKSSLKKAASDQDMHKTCIGSYRFTKNDAQMRQKSCGHQHTKYSEPAQPTVASSKHKLVRQASKQGSSNPYKYIKPSFMRSGSCDNFRNSMQRNTFLEKNTSQLSSSNLSASLIQKDVRERDRQRKLSDVASVLSKVNSIEKSLHKKGDVQVSATDAQITDEITVRNSCKQQVHKGAKVEGVLNISQDLRGRHCQTTLSKAATSTEEVKLPLSTTVKLLGSVPDPVPTVGKSGSFSGSVVKKSRFKLVKDNTVSQCRQPEHNQSIKHYGPHKMVREQVSTTSCNSACTKGDVSGFSCESDSIQVLPKKNIVTKHKLIKLSKPNTEKEMRHQSLPSSRLKSWTPTSISVSHTGFVAQKVVKSYRRKSFVRSRYKLIRGATSGSGTKSSLTYQQVARNQVNLHTRYKKRVPSRNTTHVCRKPRKSKYSIVKSSTDHVDDMFNINQALGRKVENISKNKYKFIKPKQRTLSKRNQIRSRLKIDRRKLEKSPIRQSDTSYVILRGHVYKRAKYGLVKVGKSSSATGGRMKTSKKIPDIYSKKKSAIETARHMVVRSIATVVQHKFRRDHRHLNSPRKQHKYCLYYNRFGKCSRGGKCPFIHDPEKVAVCTRFIRGTCQVTDCAFSHKVTKEKMPVCRYFMKGSCVREHCPYLHVNVGKSAEVCEDFLDGYCAAGEKCKRKHTLICPDYDTNGQCPRGRLCKMKHLKKRTSKRKVDVIRPALLQGEEPAVTSERPTVHVIPTVPEQYDDITLPMKNRHLPAFISIGSPETSTRRIDNTLAKGKTDRDSNMAEGGYLQEGLVQTNTADAAPVLQIRPNLAEED